MQDITKEVSRFSPWRPDIADIVAEAEQRHASSKINGGNIRNQNKSNQNKTESDFPEDF